VIAPGAIRYENRRYRAVEILALAPPTLWN